MTAYKLVVFDWDGTLIDSIERIVACFRHTFQDANIPWPGEGAIKETIGLPLLDAFPSLIAGCDAAGATGLVDIYREYWLGPHVPQSTLFQGVEDLLTWLGETGYTLAIATGKSRVGLDRDWLSNDIRHHFKLSRCAGEGRSKPDPDILHQIMTEAGVAPEETLLLGDHVLDLDMANAAGVDGIGVTTGSVSRERLMTSRPVACFDAVTELRGFLGS